MYRFAALATGILLLICLTDALAGGIDSINVSPPSPDDATPVEIQVAGWASANITSLSAHFWRTGNSISVDVTIRTGWLQFIQNWSRSFSLGVLPAGTYTVTASVDEPFSSGGIIIFDPPAASLTFTVRRHTIPVDVMVASTVNCANPNGLIPAAILSTEQFDARSVDQATVRFGPGAAPEAHESRGAAKRHEEDVNGDGRMDLVFHFSAAAAGLGCDAVSAYVRGMTFAGSPIEGSTPVVMTGGAAAAAEARNPHDERVLGLMPAELLVAQNYPNPFNPTTTIRYSLAGDDRVSLRVYDAFGREVATLVDGVQSAGVHQAAFDGSGLASGVYFYALRAGGHAVVRKLTLMK
jgi:hypothetical protein